MLLGVVESVWDFLQKLTTNGLTLDIIFYIAIGFIALMVIFFLIKSHYAYEGKLERSLDKLNRWLFVHQNIDETNLLEFNNMLKSKSTPKLLRYHWQQYMLYREHEPSYYISAYNCIEKPLHTSSYSANIKNFTAICWSTIIVALCLSLITYGAGGSLTVTSLSISLITPVVVIIISTIFLMLIRSLQNFNLSSLYQNFHLFNRYIDKAAITIPKYVDFEVLFTKKEIKNGIPVLGEYLEKRARQEQEELEKARQNAVEHETYDFSKSGIESSLVLDRAMKESELYINARQRLFSEIQQFETEISSLKKNYDNTTKEYQRKLQASKENIERLRIQQEESTNRIEGNYIRKQQQDEIKKQEMLEKDQEESTIKYNQEANALQEEIEKRKVELEAKKQYVAVAMESEYQTFANKLVKSINKDLESKYNAERNQLAEEKENVLKELEKSNEILAIKDQVIADLKEMMLNVNTISNKEVEDAATPTTIGKEESQAEENNIAELDTQSVKVQEDAPKEVVETEETTEQEASPIIDQQLDNQVTHTEGYDENGYYWYADGTYYDDKGLYHNGTGNIYDSEGNFVGYENEAPSDENAVSSDENLEVQKEENKANEILPEEEQTNDLEETEETKVEPEAVYEPNEEPDMSEDAQTPIEEIETQNQASESVIEESQESSVLNQEENTEKNTEENIEEISEEVKEDLIAEESQPENFANIIIDEAEDAKAMEEITEDISNENPLDFIKRILSYGNTDEQSNMDVLNEEKINIDMSVQSENADNQIVIESPAENPVDSENQTEMTEEKPKRKAGRPRKVIEPSIIETPKRKVGRPRKEKPVDEEEKPKRKAGRPRKVVEPSVAETPKRKVGRPKKEKPAEKQTEVKRRVGRPKKSENADKERLEKLSKQISEESIRLQEQEDELLKQIDRTLSKISAADEDDDK